MSRAAHGAIAAAVIHGGAHVAYHTAPRRHITLPYQIGVIPREVDTFQYRAAVEIPEVTFAEGTTAVLGYVLSGMGGVGKTQLAARFARRAWQAGNVDLLVWVTAGTRSAIVTRYAQAAADLLGVEATDAEQAAQAFMAWLEPKSSAPQHSSETGAADRAGCRWLIVLDDITDPADVKDLWPPASPCGRTVATTRRRDAALIGPGRGRIDVGLFTQAEATGFLASRLAVYGRNEAPGEMRALAAELGRLPLALSQAVAYMIDTAIGCGTYRELLADRATSLADLTPECDALPDDQANTVDAAWALSVERADQLRPYGLARPILELAAMLDAHGIPAAVLTAPPALTHMAERRPGTKAAVTTHDATKALRVLHRLGLIDHDPGTPHESVRVHQLIQRAVREQLGSEEHGRIARIAADALLAIWPENPVDSEFAQALRANTIALANNAEDALYHPDVHEVLGNLGFSLSYVGELDAAISHLQRVADVASDRLGPDNSETFAARILLATMQGRTHGARALDTAARVKEDCLCVLGPENPLTLLARNVQAWCRGMVGDWRGAEIAFTEAVQECLRVLGSDDPLTLNARNNLAWWRGFAGGHDETVAEISEILDDALRILGADHPLTINARNNLVFWKGLENGHDEALAGGTQALEECLSSLGADHPQTLKARGQFALLKGAAGDWGEATVVLSEVVEDSERVLGAYDSDTLRFRSYLLSCKYAAGEGAGAIASLASMLLTDCLRILGPHHPDTLSVRGYLAFLKVEAEEGGIAEYVEVLEDCHRILGYDHEVTRYFLGKHDLAWWRESTGNANET
ncbi:tetratricopeptide repeat protein [Streptomyces phaeochromogenes]|uniref:NB-ARC domain-containing protein n=1 Tax=Streptomyces phaeochromogenes TaxID=1923 RepID=UPI003864F1FD|nr:tetratricopeptide repeat protein [Streptomyces phaeochromogenes]